MKNKIMKVLTEPWQLITWLNQSKIGHLIPDKMMLKALYHTRCDEKLNLNNPRSFNEKMQWLKLYDRQPMYTKMSDKLAVKDIVKEKIGDEHVIKTLGVWSEYDYIDFDALPNRFVLKCNHDSGGVVIVKDKSKMDHEAAKVKIVRSLKQNFYWRGREWPYKDIHPLIFAEEYIEDVDSDDIIDYKLMCFNGKCRCIFTCTERHLGTGLKVTFFDPEWNELPFIRRFPKSEVPISKPDNLQELITIAESLAEGIPFVRVDLYDIKEQIFFGEYTFYPGCGFEKFYPKEWDDKLGGWIELPRLK